MKLLNNQEANKVTGGAYPTYVYDEQGNLVEVRTCTDMPKNLVK